MLIGGDGNDFTYILFDSRVEELRLCALFSLCSTVIMTIRSICFEHFVRAAYPNELRKLYFVPGTWIKREMHNKCLYS